jgi:ABC-type arginine/histidine transport system permease subunit
MVEFKKKKKKKKYLQGFMTIMTMSVTSISLGVFLRLVVSYDKNSVVNWVVNFQIPSSANIPSLTSNNNLV